MDVGCGQLSMDGSAKDSPGEDGGVRHNSLLSEYVLPLARAMRRRVQSSAPKLSGGLDCEVHLYKNVEQHYTNIEAV